MGMLYDHLTANHNGTLIDVEANAMGFGASVRLAIGDSTVDQGIVVMGGRITLRGKIGSNALSLAVVQGLTDTEYTLLLDGKEQIALTRHK